MLKTKKNIINQHNNSPWYLALHGAIRILSIWKTILTQFKTKIFFQKQINFYLSSLSTPISIEWFNFTEIKRKLRQAKSTLRKNKKIAKAFGTQHLLQQASAMNIKNKVTNSSTIFNIQKIKQAILM